MTYTNLPPTLFEMFGSIDDRVRKLETGPSLAYATGYDALQQAQAAQSGSIQAYSVATNAQIQAINASAQANIAQSQATVAQATASFSQSLAYAAQATANSASAQATVAQNTADGKNKVYYSLSTPGSTANSAGDIWFQYSGSGLVIGQYVGLGGTSWQQQTITQAVIGNLDAGKVTTGILNAIEITAGSGSQIFRVTPTGYLSAQGAYIKGNITADSGTFNGTVNASAGLFGNYAGGNYWSISSTGLTAVGTGTITGGLIQGSSIQVPQSSPQFQVFSDGSISSTAGTIGGTTISSTALTSGTIQTSSGSNAVILNGSANALQFKAGGSVVANMLNQSSSAALWHYGSSPDSSGNTYPKIVISSTSATIYGSSTFYFSADAAGNTISGTMTISGATTFSNTITANGDVNLGNTQELRVPYAYSTTVTNAATVWISSTGQFRRSTASSQRYKTNIVNLNTQNNLDPRKLLSLQTRAFKYKSDYLSENDPRAEQMIPGFIAEEVAEAYPIAADMVDGKPESWNERMLIPGILALVQEHETRLAKLEGN